MQASYLQSIWIIVRSILSTLGYSLLTLFCALFRIHTRERMDKFMRTYTHNLLRFAKIDYKVFGAEHAQFLPNKPYIIMSNHQSLYDIPLIYVGLPGSVRMLTKKELVRIPIWGHAMKYCEFISIDRHNHQQALRDLEYAKQKMLSGVILWIAPEGTRSRTKALGPFKKGGFMLALQTKATIIPVGIRGAYDILPPKTWRMKIGQKAEIHIGAPIDAGQYDINQRDQLMAEVEKSIRELADL